MIRQRSQLTRKKPMKRKGKKRPTTAQLRQTFCERMGLDPTGVAWTGRASAQADFTYDPSRAQPKKLPGRSEAYLDHVRNKPCCVCQAPGPSDPHHVAPRGQKAMSGKVSDFHTVPLCREHHSMWHAGNSIIVNGVWWGRDLFDIVKVPILIEWCELQDKEGRYS